MLKQSTAGQLESNTAAGAAFMVMKTPSSALCWRIMMLHDPKSPGSSSCCHASIIPHAVNIQPLTIHPQELKLLDEHTQIEVEFLTDGRLPCFQPVKHAR